MTVNKPIISREIGEFRFKYQLEVEKKLNDSVQEISHQISPSIFLALLIRTLSEYVFKPAPKWEDIRLILSYLHFMVSQPECPEVFEKDISVLFFAFRKIMRKKKRRIVALILNCIRKCL